MLLAKVRERFQTKIMKEKLFKMVKNKGTYCRFDNQYGYVYSLKLESVTHCILIEVAFKDMYSICILDATHMQSQSSQAVM
ncbi:hypothetical protein CJ195_15765 [Bacillus sp. UMB0899]|nr:hypothetical protein CJ195_15765 [Bacillus sp. UMB0899]